MIEQITKWLRDGGELEAADLFIECSLNYIYVDTLFEVNGEREYELVDVNIEAPRILIEKIKQKPFIKKQIEDAICNNAQTINEQIRDIVWVPKLISDNISQIDEEISTAFSRVDSARIKLVWGKLLERKNRDPEGTLTLAKTLIETVCKYILDKSGTTYPRNSDLPKLYYLTAQQLVLLPSQNEGNPYQNMMGCCQSIINTLSSIRNSLGDAHGKSENIEVPDNIDVELIVNLAGAISLYILSIWSKERNIK